MPVIFLISNSSFCTLILNARFLDDLKSYKKAVQPGPVWFFGAGERNRTPDLFITNELLYRLSYSGHDLRTSAAFNCTIDGVNELPSQLCPFQYRGVVREDF